MDIQKSIKRVKKNEYDEVFHDVLNNNTIICNFISIAIHSYFVNQRILSTVENIDNFFENIKIKPELIVSKSEDVSFQQNIILFYIFGFEKYSSIRIEFSKENYNRFKEDLMYCDFMRVITWLVSIDKFRRMKTIDGGLYFQDFEFQHLTLKQSIMTCIKNYFVIFVASLTNDIFLLKHYNILFGFIKKIVNVEYCGNLSFIQHFSFIVRIECWRHLLNLFKWEYQSIFDKKKKSYFGKLQYIVPLDFFKELCYVNFHYRVRMNLIWLCYFTSVNQYYFLLKYENAEKKKFVEEIYIPFVDENIKFTESIDYYMDLKKSLSCIEKRVIVTEDEEKLFLKDVLISLFKMYFYLDKVKEKDYHSHLLLYLKNFTT